MKSLRFALVGCLVIGQAGCGGPPTPGPTAGADPSGPGPGANATDKKPVQAEPADYEKLQGKWKVADAQRDGKQYLDLRNKKPWAEGSTFAFVTKVASRDHVCEIWDANERLTFKRDYELAPTKDPKEIDFDIPSLGLAYKGIYKLEGDTLSICEHPEIRPTEFATKPGDGRTLYILKRDSGKSGS
jgi:uncharacterized protein (TIGR03067 family)